MIDKVLVLGGTGFVGRSLCETLVERAGGNGVGILVPTRRIARARPIQLLPGLQAVEADVHDDARLARLVAGQDAVVNLVAILHGSEVDFQRVHVELPRRLARACAGAGVRRIVHISALGADPSAPSRYLRSKAAGEAALTASGLDVTILRPSVMFGAQDRFLNLFARLQALFPLLPLGGADSRYQPVWVEDVAAAIVRCLDDPTTVGQVIECAGPDVYTLRQLVEAAGRWSGHRRPVLALPEPLARLQALAMECLPGEPLMSRDNLDSMRVASVASSSRPGLERLGIRSSALEAVAPEYLGRGQGPARMNAWRARARRF